MIYVMIIYRVILIGSVCLGIILTAWGFRNRKAIKLFRVKLATATAKGKVISNRRKKTAEELEKIDTELK